MDATALRDRYDAQLRTDAEVADVDEVARMGPLYLATMPLRGRGFITYRDLAGLQGDGLDELVARALAHYRDDPRVGHVEWKTRGHDLPAELPQLLTRHGFVAEETETVMVGTLDDVVAASSGLAVGYRLVRADDEASLRACEAVAGSVFGDSPEDSATMADALVHRWRTQPEGFEMWAVQDETGAVVCSGRIDFVEGTDFATIWGGSCLPAHRGRGIYRALTAARAERARLRGKHLVQSDCTDMSRPILERAGLVAVTTTTPWVWRRG